MSKDSQVERERIWFIARAGQISGPLCQVDIEGMLASPGQSEQLMVWGRGLAGWLKPQAWREALRARSGAITQARVEASWALEIEGKEYGPFTFDEVVAKAQSFRDSLHRLQVRSAPGGPWLDLGHFPPILEALKMPRLTKRAALMGTARIEYGEGKSAEAQLVDITEVGLGLARGPRLEAGAQVQVQLDSPSIGESIRFSAIVVYRQDSGRCGLRIHEITAESYAYVVDYVRKFNGALKRIRGAKASARAA